MKEATAADNSWIREKKRAETEQNPDVEEQQLELAPQPGGSSSMVPIPKVRNNSLLTDNGQFDDRVRQWRNSSLKLLEQPKRPSNVEIKIDEFLSNLLAHAKAKLNQVSNQTKSTDTDTVLYAMN